MYIYHTLINALSAHMIHINLNMIFYTHVRAQSYKNNHKSIIRKNKKHTHYTPLNKGKKKTKMNRASALLSELLDTLYHSAVLIHRL